MRVFPGGNHDGPSVRSGGLPFVCGIRSLSSEVVRSTAVIELILAGDYQVIMLRDSSH